MTNKLLFPILVLAASMQLRSAQVFDSKEKEVKEAIVQAVAGNFNGLIGLMQQGLNINIPLDSGTPLFQAAKLSNKPGAERVIQYLLGQRGIDVNLGDENGRTALMLAAINGSENIVRILLGAGANPLAVDQDNQTALMMVKNNIMRNEISESPSPRVLALKRIEEILQNAEKEEKAARWKATVQQMQLPKKAVEAHLKRTGQAQWTGQAKPLGEEISRYL